MGKENENKKNESTNNLAHALDVESRAGITSEKLNKVSFALSGIREMIVSIQSEIYKFSSVLEELKKIEGIEDERSSIAVLARKKYRALLKELYEKVLELGERY